MGSTWKWAILAAVIEVGTIGSAQPVGFLADADARACLTRSYSVVPQPSTSVDPNEPWPVDYSQMTRTSVPNGEVVVSYVVAALSSAVLAALACLLVLALAGIVMRVQQSPAQPGSIEARFPPRQIALVAKELPAESVTLFIPFRASDSPSATPS